MADESSHLSTIKQIDADISAWSDVRLAYLQDMEAVVIGGEKLWHASDLEDRKDKKRAVISYNLLQPIVRAVRNGVIGRHYGVTLTADSVGTTQQEADFRAGVIRAIRISGGARQACDFAIGNAVAGGYGAYRYVIEAGRDGQNKIAYKRIKNSLMVVPDPDAQEAALSDMMRCTVYEDVPKKKYKRQWPKGQALSIETPSSVMGWVTGDRDSGTIRVAEFWEVEEDETTGERRVYQTILDAGGILKERELQPGRWIPIFFVLGEESDVDGRRVLKSAIRDAKDPQRFFNLWESNKYDFLSGRENNVPIVTPAMISDPEIVKTWEAGSKKAFKVIAPDPSFNGGMPFYPDSPPIPSGFSEAAQESAEYIKVTSGVYDARLGAKTTAVSGRARALEQEQSEVSTAHFEEALRAAIEHECRVLNDILPQVFTQAQFVAFASEDGKVERRELAGINGIMDWKRSFGFNDGAYGVRVTTSPDFKTRREQFLSFFSEVMTKNPLIGQIGAPEMIRAIDIPGGEELATMLEENQIQQGLRRPKEEDSEIPIAVRVELQKAQQMVDQLTQRLEQMTAEREQIIQAAEADKAAIEARATAAQDLAKAQIDSQVELQKAEMQEATKREAARLREETRIFEANLKAQTDLQIAAIQTNPVTAPGAVVLEIERGDTGAGVTAFPEPEATEAGYPPGGENL